MSEPTNEHSHTGIETAIILVLGLICLGIFGSFLGQQYQFDVIYDRVGEIQRQLECSPGELLVTDHDGVEYCLNPAEK